MNNTKKIKPFSYNYKKGLKISRFFSYLFLILLCLICLFPFFILLINSTRLNSEIQKGFTLIPSQYFFRNARNLFTDANIPILRGLLNSVYISTCTAVLTVYISSMTAFGIYMYNFKLRRFAFSFIMLVMMVPIQVSALGFIKLMIKFGLMDTFYPLILPGAAAPVVVFFMIQYMQSVLPFEIVEAARVDGSNEFYTFNRIVIPILKPAFALQMIFSFVSSWNNYFMPALIINSKNKKTIPILIAQLRGADYMKFDYGKVYMLICVAILPLIIIYLFLSRFIIQGVTLGSVKG
ncbi:MAG: carbohydrate ABC transporter permease [Pleomorphochaeta sp.]